MLSSASSRQIIELKAGGPEDPHGSRTAVVLAAYFHAEHTRTFRQLLWRRLALVGGVWALAAALTPAISRTVFVGGVAVLIAVGGGAAIIEWRAAEKLSELLEGRAKRLAVIRNIQLCAPHDKEVPA